jgi:putative ABC transport system ATP-binding protein
MEILRLSDLTFSYYGENWVLHNVNASFETGKMYVIYGSSGSGKTTLLSLIGGLDIPSSGEIYYENKNIMNIGYANHRRHNISFIFQNYNLIEYMTAAENVGLVTTEPPFPFLERVGLSQEEMKRGVLKLSGGQQQRVAIARAMASGANVVLADEPTGNLDEGIAAHIVNLLLEEAQEKCVIVASHSSLLVQKADHVFELKDKGLRQC